MIFHNQLSNNQNCIFANQVKERGGYCVPVICDSSKDEDIEQLFEQIKREQNGRLDILVNNAYAGVQVSEDWIDVA